MEGKQQAKILRSGVRVREINSEALRRMWDQNLTSNQRSVLEEAGILPFLKAVTYRCDTALCAALIDFMVDGELRVREKRMQITEEKIHQATGLPNSGRHLYPCRDYDRAEITISLTKSEMGEKYSGLLLDAILDPTVQFACKFLAYKLLGVKRAGYIPFKFVQTAIEVSQGVCFNWCKFVKERMLQQIESVQQKRMISFNYSTILQYLAIKAFGESSIPRSVIGHGDPSINEYDIWGRDVSGRKGDKENASKEISSILYNIMEEHGKRVLSGSEGKEIQKTKTVEESVERKRMMHDGYVWDTHKKACANELPSCSKSQIPEMSNNLILLSDATITVEENGCTGFNNSNKLDSSSQLPGSDEAPNPSSGGRDLCVLSNEDQGGKKDKGLDCVHTDLSRSMEMPTWDVRGLRLKLRKYAWKMERSSSRCKTLV